MGYAVSCISVRVVRGNFVGHQTFAKKHDRAAPPVSTLPIRMPVIILIAEDNPAVRSAMHTLLEGAGPWEILDVENGQEAVAKAQELKPNLILLDLVMPVLDGLSAARQISKLLPGTPMLMYTMHWSQQVELEAQKFGVRKLISKTDSKLLVSTVQELLLAELAAPVTLPSPILPSNLPNPNHVPPLPSLEANSAAEPEKSRHREEAEPGEVPGNQASK